ncbi:hypothetical protein WJX72_009026 [[Myrmecia] bisecta]|uniref:C-CAP/cofactor C-like domain-containing protein n=1 Tax=[Myrmecia] bisecta TaxID=41462 RepID=A0AAW1P4X0_9CHLO
MVSMSTPASTDAACASREDGVLNRLAAREAARQADKAKRNADLRSVASPAESATAFQQSFKEQKQSIETALLEISSRGAMQGGASEAVRAQLESLAVQVGQLEKATAEASYFLPSYDQRQITAATAVLRQAVDSTKSAVLPRKKFSFSKKAAGKPSRPPSEATASRADAAGTAGIAGRAAGRAAVPSIDGTSAAAALEDPNAQMTSASSPPQFAPGRGLQGLRGVTVTKHAAELRGDDYTLVDLEDCTVCLLGTLSALRMHKLRRCRVCTGPVTGATFVEDVRDSELMLASFQGHAVAQLESLAD